MDGDGNHVNTGSLAEKKERLLARLRMLPGGTDRMAWLAERARQSPPLEPAFRTEANEVAGCTARLWLAAEFRDARCWFRTDSESLVVKAVALLLCEFYSGAAPAEILATDPSFLRPAGIVEHLTANRRNALSRVWDRIRSFAQSCQRGEETADGHR